MSKIHKPTGIIVHKLSKCDKHHCGCTDDHSHEELYGKLEEVPAIFSYATDIELSSKMTGTEIESSLVNWIEDVRQWVTTNKYFIGHIKIFAESEEGFNLWVSTTGKKVNIKSSHTEQESNIKTLTINMTVIVFGTNEQNLRAITLENLRKNLPYQSK